MALKGVKVVEMMGLAPGPFCGTILADFGAEVTVIQRISGSPFDVMSNGKKLLPLNLKTKDGIQVLRKLCNKSDVLLDTYRPGILEKMGLGPDTLLKSNPRLIYARLSGYGQNGMYKAKAGHDINYVAMSGVLSLLTKDNKPPTPPINLLADFAGGSVLCSLGILAALYERTFSGKGQVVDSSMTEGAAYIATWLFKSKHLPIWSGEPGTNALDGGFACYKTYRTKDDKFVAVGALEPQFYSDFIKGLQLIEDNYPQSVDFTKEFQNIFLTKTQDEWCKVYEDLDACVTPVLPLDKLVDHHCHDSRKVFYKDEDGLTVPETAPKLSRTPGQSVGRKPPPKLGEHSLSILTELGYTLDEVKNLQKDGVIGTDLPKSNL